MASDSGRVASSTPADIPSELRTQLTFRGVAGACEAFRLNKARLHSRAYVCIECSLNIADHNESAVSDADISAFVSFSGQDGAASRIVDQSLDGALGGLLVGSYTASLAKTLDDKHISAVVNCCDIEKVDRSDFKAWATTVRALELPPRSLRILRLSWGDTVTQRLWRDVKFDQLAEALRFIHTERLRGANVLVHCMAGISRSGTVATAYVMAAENLGFDAALARVQHRRPIVRPNPGFVAQLLEFERSSLLLELRGEFSRRSGGASSDGI